MPAASPDAPHCHTADERIVLSSRELPQEDRHVFVSHAQQSDERLWQRQRGVATKAIIEPETSHMVPTPQDAVALFYRLSDNCST